ncbi:MAG: PCMD domain-containing protein [Bacteroidales bacterium]|nr:PCMD domain-containing protein [Bacteroidales bacterium]
MEKIQISLCLLLLSLLPLSAQRVETVPFGDFEHWTVRHIKESAILGGETRTLYVVGPDEVIEGNRVYDYARTPWASSNAYARISGVTKTSLSAEPDEGPSGRCARLSTVFASCRVAGLVDIQVLATGSLYWGKMLEPISGVRNPYANMDWGIPFTQRPAALLLDYKALLSNSGKLVRGTTFRKEEFPGTDPCQVMLLLQRRWEDEEGNVHAERVGTAFLRIPASSTQWVMDKRIPVWYGDARKQPGYQSYMGLVGGERTLYTRNSKGKRVPILEEGWAEADTPCTHAVLHISSGSRGGYTGALGNTLWVDNIRLEYER